jgi:hypothetical protein
MCEQQFFVSSLDTTGVHYFCSKELEYCTVQNELRVRIGHHKKYILFQVWYIVLVAGTNKYCMYAYILYTHG